MRMAGLSAESGAGLLPSHGELQVGALTCQARRLPQPVRREQGPGWAGGFRGDAWSLAVREGIGLPGRDPHLEHSGSQQEAPGHRAE